ncbi:MAG TPA: integrase arm-type DNA-binding domain-containing protein [Pseudolabrys sp.]|nr:integrase arm-type DNA-binding domain-containing protein [Pseudolabrys sp.]
MARTIDRLSALKVARTTEPGMYADGGGLYLQVTSSAARSWLFRYTLSGRSREMGLGPLSAVTLLNARQKAAEARRLRADGIDPIVQQTAARASAATDAARAMTFDQCSDAYIASHQGGWRSPKHAAQWKSTLSTYASPVFGGLPVHAVDVTLVMKALEPIWTVIPETAGRVRGRIESVLDWAKSRGLRTGENPARWKGHLDNLLPARSKVAKVVHHPALPYDELPAFMAVLRAQGSISARALEFTILTAGRTNEIIGALRSEVNDDEAVWTVPANKMKGDREHRVPLSDRGLAIVRALPIDGPYLFAGARADGRLSNMAMLKLLERMKRDDLTVHGFRSTFRDWASEQTNFAGEVAEAALAHVVGDKTEAAYRRGDLFEKRRRLMAAWAEYSTKHDGSATVLPIGRTG